MLLNRLRSAKVSVPVGMATIICGLFLVVFSAIMPHLSTSLTHSSQTGDFLRGLAIGIGISLEIGGLILLLPAARAAYEQRHNNTSFPNA